MSSSEEDAQFAGKHILIVDDNPQNVELLEAYLDAMPCETTIATDGIEAIEAIGKATPDLVLLDVMMPRMSGFEVCQKIKNDPATRNIPVIMVTALNEVGDVERGVDAGADDFLSKPFNKVEFLERVRSMLQVRTLRRDPGQVFPPMNEERASEIDEATSPTD